MKGCLDAILDPFNADVQDKSMEKLLKSQLEAYGFVPEMNEPEPTAAYWAEDSEDSASEGEDELDIMKRRTEGIRKSNRAKTQTKPFFGSATIASDQIVIDGDDGDVVEFE